MRKIKVMFFIYQMGGGGAARTLLNIINNLDRTTFTPVLVTLNFNGAYEKELREDVTFIKLKTKRLRHSVFKLAKIIRKEQADVIFSTIPNVNTIAILAKWLSFTRVRSVIREADHLGGSLTANLKLLCFGLVYKFSDQIIALSEGVRDNLHKRYKVNPANVSVIYNPIDLENIQEKIIHEKPDSQFTSLFETEEKVIVTAGRLVEQKDHQTLLRAFTKVNDHTASRLLVLGEGPLKNDLLQQAHSLHIQDRVHFIGFQENPYIYFKNADLFVLSSKHEGFSHVIAEALATGTPVVSSNCRSGPEEVLNKGEFGLLCEVGNADQLAEKMLEVLTLSEENVDEMIRKGYIRVKDFEARKIVQQYEKVLLETSHQ